MTAVVTVALATASSSARADRPGFAADAVYKVPIGHAPVTGPADAPVTIVAWSDYACAYCNRVQQTLDHLARLYPGQLRWVHRTLPLDDDDTVAAEASLAAESQGRFLPMNDRLYALSGRVDRAAVELIARELGLDMVRFRADLDTRKFRPIVDDDAADARRLGVSGTPMFFINGRPINGNQPLYAFADVVDQELARAGKHAGGYDALVGSGREHADTADEPKERRQLERTQGYRVGLGLPGHQLGPDDALVTLIVWSDFQCPFCAREAPVLTQLHERYPMDLRIIYRHFALQFHKNAQLAAEAGVAAAAQGKFWAFHDQVWANFGHLERADLEQFASAAGLDMAAFRAALADRRYRDVVVAETASAEALGVDGTPTMFINGSPIGGALPLEAMQKLVEAHIARAKQVVAAGVTRADFYALIMSAAIGDERADPSRIPVPQAMKLEPRSDDKVRAVAAACRRRDAARASSLAEGLAGDARRRAQLVCAGVGIDL